MSYSIGNFLLSAATGVIRSTERTINATWIEPATLEEYGELCIGLAGGVEPGETAMLTAQTEETLLWVINSGGGVASGAFLTAINGSWELYECVGSFQIDGNSITVLSVELSGPLSTTGTPGFTQDDGSGLLINSAFIGDWFQPIERVVPSFWTAFIGTAEAAGALGSAPDPDPDPDPDPGEVGGDYLVTIIGATQYEEASEEGQYLQWGYFGPDDGGALVSAPTEVYGISGTMVYASSESWIPTDPDDEPDHGAFIDFWCDDPVSHLDGMSALLYLQGSPEPVPATVFAHDNVMTPSGPVRVLGIYSAGNLAAPVPIPEGTTFTFGFSIIGLAPE